MWEKNWNMPAVHTTYRKVYCKAVFNFENVSDLRGRLRPKKKSRLIHSTRDMGRLLSIWINNPIIIVTNLSNIFCSKDKEQKSWSGIPIFCLQQTFFHDSSQVSNKTTKSRVSLKKYIWLCFRYLIKLLIPIWKMIFVFHKSKRT